MEVVTISPPPSPSPFWQSG